MEYLNYVRLCISNGQNHTFTVPILGLSLTLFSEKGRAMIQKSCKKVA